MSQRGRDPNRTWGDVQALERKGERESTPESEAQQSAFCAHGSDIIVNVCQVLGELCLGYTSASSQC